MTVLVAWVACWAASACGPAADAPDDAGVRRDASHEGSASDVVTRHAEGGQPTEAEVSPETSPIESSVSSQDAADEAAPADASDAADAASPDAFGDAGVLDAYFPDAPLDVYPAPHPPMPTVVYNGGATIVGPNLIPVFYAGDPYQSELVSFLSGLVSTSFWPATTSQYGIGAATVGTPIVVNGPPPSSIDDPEIQAWLLANLTGSGDAGPPWGSPASNDVYVLYFPAATAVEPPCGCGAYHSIVPLSSTSGLVYTVQWELDNTLDGLTSESSHEIVEATTDPYLGAGWEGTDQSDLAWEVPFDLIFNATELADMCERYPSSLYTPPDLPYEIQRTWSNVSAAGSHDPCVPIPPGEVYFNSALVPTDNVVFQGEYITHGVKIPRGTSRTVEVDLYSDGPTSGPWTLAASTLDGALDFSFDTNTGVNGDRVQLTITVVTEDVGFTGEAFTITSTLGSMTTYWYGFVGY
jgi:hypothetical protein